jgi:putative FmdB family regulatory protein
MPLYEYRCTVCDLRFELLRAYDQTRDGAPCPRCQGASRRLVSACAAAVRGSEPSGAGAGGTGGCGACSGGNCASCR